MIYESDEGALAGTKTVIDVDVDDSKTPMSGLRSAQWGSYFFFCAKSQISQRVAMVKWFVTHSGGDQPPQPPLRLTVTWAALFYLLA